VTRDPNWHLLECVYMTEGTSIKLHITCPISTRKILQDPWKRHVCFLHSTIVQGRNVRDGPILETLSSGSTNLSEAVMSKCSLFGKTLPIPLILQVAAEHLYQPLIGSVYRNTSSHGTRYDAVNVKVASKRGHFLTAAAQTIRDEEKAFRMDCQEIGQKRG
jgi:hypothetical protein